MSGPVRTSEEAATYLDGLINRERAPERVASRLGLEPIRALLSRLGHPEADLSIVHVAGSKGKGSTALLLESLLRAAGEHVGVFTSPHLERWTERFRIDGREVPGAGLAAAVETLRPHVDALRSLRPDDAPSFFDATTAAGLWLFRRAGVDRVILEVGLGGRLDSTNAVTPAVTCITSIELEHTDKLGGTLAAIAGEKAGIVKRGVPLVTGPLPQEAEGVIGARAAELEAPWSRVGPDIEIDVHEAGPRGLDLQLRDGSFAFRGELPILGAHQAVNAGLALACLLRLPGRVPDERLDDVVRRGFAEAALPGRAEIVSRSPWVVVDAAHTAASARALVAALETLPPRRTHLVLSVASDKDVAGLLEILLPLASQVTVTRAEPTRSLDPRTLAAAIGTAAPDVSLRVVPNPHLAVRAAREGLSPDDRLVVTGSFYLAGIARHVLAPSPRASSGRTTSSASGRPRRRGPRAPRPPRV